MLGRRKSKYINRRRATNAGNSEAIAAQGKAAKAAKRASKRNGAALVSKKVRSTNQARKVRGFRKMKRGF